MQIDRHDIRGLTFSDGLVVSGEAILRLDITEGEQTYLYEQDQWVSGHLLVVVYVDDTGHLQVKKSYLEDVQCVRSWQDHALSEE